jgi:hypothetical protein
MARVSSNHCLGLLVIDEIQDLSEAKSGGASSMLSFFVHLENRIGVPFVLIGTPQAIPILSGQFRQARRASEQGDVIWSRMNQIKEVIEGADDDDDEDYDEETEILGVAKTCEQQGQEVDPVWRDFVQTLWTYQYVKHVTQLKDDLLKDKRARALYAASKGIPAVALTVFVLAQRRAITSGHEKITSGIIRSVAHDSQNLVKSMLDNPIRRPKTIPAVADLTDWDISEEVSEDYNGLLEQPLQQAPSIQPDDEISSVDTKSKSQPKSSKEAPTQQTRKESKKGNTGKTISEKQNTRLSKADLRNSANRKKTNGNSKSSRRGRYNKSLTDYT